MPGQNTTTVGSTLQDEEFKRILIVRQMECFEQLSQNATPPPDTCHQKFISIYIRNQIETKILSTTIFSPFEQPFCPGTFDGWSCWTDTPAGEKAFAPCPYFITGFDIKLKAYKYCEPNGTWFRHPETNREWSNYTTCVDVEDLEWQQRLNVIFQIGYTISLIAVIMSLCIFTYFRSLRCARITLHMNFFTSFVMSSVLWIIWYMTVISDTEVLAENGVSCRLLNFAVYYFVLTNYSWSLCEGFYLHTILVNAFTSEHNLVKWLVVLGWSTPAFLLPIYAILRGTSDDPQDNAQCWHNEGSYMLILTIPVLVSIIINLMFLCNIVRVVVIKLRAGPAIGTRPSRSILQAFRATLLLVPLLGLQHLFTLCRPSSGNPWERPYDVIVCITSSFQGLCVATLFCFCNGEVISQFKRKWEGTAFMRKRANSCTATTVSVRLREKKRCDYQVAASMDEKDEKFVGNRGATSVTFAAATRRSSNSLNNHTRALIRRNDSSHDFNQYQTQC